MFSTSEFAQEMFQLHCFIPLLRVFVMAGLWSNPSEFPRLPDEEEIGGEMNLVGPGGSSGYGVDEDTGMFGPGRSSGMNLVGPGGSPGYGVVEDTGMFGPGRSSGFGQIDDDMSNDGLGQAITPFRGGEMQGGPSPSGPISLFGNTRRMGHGDDLSMVMTQTAFAVIVNTLSVAFIVLSAQCATMQYIQIAVRSLE